MKITAAIAEYNPFHNGHLVHLSEMKKTGADLVVVLMSGDFTQRGEPAELGKLVRARHAVLAGADLVLELPAVFATAGAELFAEGAMKLVAGLPGEKTLCFGAETPDRDAFFAAARALTAESKDFKAKLKEKLKDGAPFAKARTDALGETEGKATAELLASPNNILGAEYTRQIVKNKYSVEILPIPRIGADHLDEAARGPIASSSAVRLARAAGEKRALKRMVPPFVAKDLLAAPAPDLDALIYYALLVRPAEEIAKTADCTEGLENRLKALLKDSPDYRTLLQKAATRRYTDARIRRICIANLLDVREEFVRKCLKGDLYYRVLAVRDASNALSLLSSAAYPVLTRRSDAGKLSRSALECFQKDVLAADLYDFAAGISSAGDFAMIRL